MPDIRALPTGLHVLLAMALLAMTLAWHVPMMLWDHLDLVPLLEAARNGNLGATRLLEIHGGHLHAAAYLVLLVTTTVSGGQPWLDCMVSWTLLLATALLVRSLSRESFLTHSPRDPCVATLLALLALHPGHLANLQWGWQVAVFLCLAGVLTCIHQLTRARLDGKRLVVALAAAGMACLGRASRCWYWPYSLSPMACT